MSEQGVPGLDPSRRSADAYSRVGVVRTRAAGDGSGDGGGADDLLRAVARHALDPAVIEEFPPFLFTAEISSTRWDSYGTRMGISTLRNYAEDAADGVAFIRNHNPQVDPAGASVTARFVGGQGNGVARVEADCAIFPLDADRVAYINAIRAGTVRDVSVGFYGGWWECSLCGRDMRQFLGPNACPHLLMVTYTPTDEAGHPTGEPQVARATVQDARLAEISGVFGGSTPGAMILKARHLAAEGRLSVAERGLVEVRYRIALPEPARVFALTGGAGDERSAAGGQPTKERTAVPEELTRGQGQPAPGGVEAAGGGVDQQRALADLATRLQAVEAERDAARAQIEAQRAALEAATGRVVAMERAARQQRFTEIVTGARDGVRWPGEPETHVGRLERLAETWGEDSDDFKGYVAEMRAVAEQVRTANLYAEVGSAVPKAGRGRASEAQGRVDALVAELRAANPSLSREIAEAQVWQRHPELYDEMILAAAAATGKGVR